MIEIPLRPSRKFLPEDFSVSGFENLTPYTESLLNRNISDRISLEQWLADRSELESVIAEDLGWRTIRMTCYTDNEQYQQEYQFFIEKIQPELAPVSDQLNRKLLVAESLPEIENLPGYDIMIRSVRKEVELFREENVPLFTRINTLTQKYAQISGAMTIEWEGKEMTLQQASVILQDNDRNRREAVWKKITSRRMQETAELDELFTELVRLRHNVAVNAGFSNFRDYMFRSLGRFDYTPSDCVDFHHSVEQEVIPLLNMMAKARCKGLGIDQLRPWDKAVDAQNRPALKAFRDGKDLLEKSKICLGRLDSYLGKCLSTMEVMQHLDLESRIGKAPGGYNYPLPETGVPFIFMNATSTLRDMTTLMHEGGHAVHNFLTRELKLVDFKNPPMEVAELASMSMELLTMDHWDVFFSNSAELTRARTEQLEDIIETLPWVATIDHFQHWIYENPGHTSEDRKLMWSEIFSKYTDSVTDWTGLEAAKAYLWQKQLHLYEVPFYYIEYGMAQLGAIAIWRVFRENPGDALAGYKKALSLGNMTTIPAIYEAAGIRFDFSGSYIRELVKFIQTEWQASQ
ncbi:MAG: M3 family oligoendopeptidase [Cyclobacteriaceae bacterium]